MSTKKTEARVNEQPPVSFKGDSEDRPDMGMGKGAGRTPSGTREVRQ
jgi:hypothetical protein